jgi:DNA-directed RNA polymerase subunit RPC12/RpoP
MSSLKGKAKNIVISPSMISDDYVHAFFYCACCGKKFGEADYRREDIEEMQKHSKPLCKNCAKFLSEWQAKNDKQLLKRL